MYNPNVPAEEDRTHINALLPMRSELYTSGFTICWIFQEYNLHEVHEFGVHVIVM
jgi:hypothetical protein